MLETANIFTHSYFLYTHLFYNTTLLEVIKSPYPSCPVTSAFCTCSTMELRVVETFTAAVLISTTCSIFPTSVATFCERTLTFLFKALYASSFEVMIDRRIINLGLVLDDRWRL